MKKCGKGISRKKPNVLGDTLYWREEKELCRVRDGEKYI